MGRKKIKIQQIENTKQKQATFNKRKVGLMKKAIELAILCSTEIAVICFYGDRLYLYSSCNMDDILKRYSDYVGTYEELTNDDLEILKPGQKQFRTATKSRRDVSSEPRPAASFPATATSDDGGLQSLATAASELDGQPSADRRTQSNSNSNSNSSSSSNQVQSTRRASSLSIQIPLSEGQDSITPLNSSILQVNRRKSRDHEPERKAKAESMDEDPPRRTSTRTSRQSIGARRMTEDSGPVGTTVVQSAFPAVMPSIPSIPGQIPGSISPVSFPSIFPPVFNMPFLEFNPYRFLLPGLDSSVLFPQLLSQLSANSIGGVTGNSTPLMNASPLANTVPLANPLTERQLPTFAALLASAQSGAFLPVQSQPAPNSVSSSVASLPIAGPAAPVSRPPTAPVTVVHNNTAAAVTAQPASRKTVRPISVLPNKRPRIASNSTSDPPSRPSVPSGRMSSDDDDPPDPPPPRSALSSGSSTSSSPASTPSDTLLSPLFGREGADITSLISTSLPMISSSLPQT